MALGKVSTLVAGAENGTCISFPLDSSGEEFTDGDPKRWSVSIELSEGVFFRKRDINVFRLGPADAGGEMLVVDRKPLNEPLFLGVRSGDLYELDCVC